MFTTGTTNRTSAHYAVGQDGSLVQFVPDHLAAWHAGTKDMNQRSIGIDHLALPGDKITKAQENTSIRLIKYLVEVHNIKPVNIIPHAEVVSTDCPSTLLSAYGVTPKDAVKSWIAQNL
jgi:N-acetylmuramoyl-L-alanine amidase